MVMVVVLSSVHVEVLLEGLDLLFEVLVTVLVDGQVELAVVEVDVVQRYLHLLPNIVMLHLSIMMILLPTVLPFSIHASPLQTPRATPTIIIGNEPRRDINKVLVTLSIIVLGKGDLNVINIKLRIVFVVVIVVGCAGVEVVIGGLVD